MTSPELTGGTGFTYEDAVAAYYLTAMLAGTTAAGLSSRVVQRVAQQQASNGEPLDDVIVDARGVADGSTMRLSLQVKRSLTVSGAASITDFREVIQHSWQTLQKTDFREQVDRVGAVASTISENTFRAFTTVCEWARSSESATSFLQRFHGEGNPYVARQFFTLCERAGAAYPVETFADQVLAQISDGRLPASWKGTGIPASIAGLVQAYADRLHPLPTELARKLLQVLDALVDLGDRRSAALQLSESFRGVGRAATA